MALYPVLASRVHDKVAGWNLIAECQTKRRSTSGAPDGFLSVRTGWRMGPMAGNDRTGRDVGLESFLRAEDARSR